MATIRKRRVGRTSLEVTELSLGTASMAALFVDVPDDDARAGVEARALGAGGGSRAQSSVVAPQGLRCTRRP